MNTLKPWIHALAFMVMWITANAIAQIIIGRL